jgi:hypothetical protein
MVGIHSSFELSPHGHFFRVATGCEWKHVLELRGLANRLVDAGAGIALWRSKFGQIELLVRRL